MINDLKAYLAADSTLQGLLYADSNNPKIFLLQEIPEGETTPFLRMSYANDGTGDDLIDESVITISVFGEKYDIVRQIVNQLTVLLDVWDQLSVTSSYFRFLYSKKVGGTDRFEEDRRLYHSARMFRVKFKRLSGG